MKKFHSTKNSMSSIKYTYCYMNTKPMKRLIRDNIDDIKWKNLITKTEILVNSLKRGIECDDKGNFVINTDIIKEEKQIQMTKVPKLIDKKLFERKKTFSMSSLSNRKKLKKDISLLSYPNTLLTSRTISSSLSKNEKKVSNLFNSKTIKRNDKIKKFHSNTISTKESVV